MSNELYVEDIMASLADRFYVLYYRLNENRLCRANMKNLNKIITITKKYLDELAQIPVDEFDNEIRCEYDNECYKFEDILHIIYDHMLWFNSMLEDGNIACAGASFDDMLSNYKQNYKRYMGLVHRYFKEVEGAVGRYRFNRIKNLL